MPGIQEGIERGVGFAHRLAGVVPERFGDEFAVGVKVLYALGSDGDFNVVYVVPGRRLAEDTRPGSGSSISWILWIHVFRLRKQRAIRRHRRLARLGFVDLDGVTIKG